MKTSKDIQQVAKLVDRLLKLGVPENICVNIHIWNKKQEEEIRQRQIAKEIKKEDNN